MGMRDGQATLGLVGGVAFFWRMHSPCPTTLTAMERAYTFDGILMFHLWYINISPYGKPSRNFTGGQDRVNGESKRSFALALASLAIGAVVVGVFGNPKTRARIAEGSRSLVKKTKRLSKRADVA